MDIDDLLPRKGNDPLASLVSEDLDRLSRDELLERITLLEGEIARTRAKLEGARRHRSAADALFAKKS